MRLINQIPWFSCVNLSTLTLLRYVLHITRLVVLYGKGLTAFPATRCPQGSSASGLLSGEALHPLALDWRTALIHWKKKLHNFWRYFRLSRTHWNSNTNFVCYNRGFWRSENSGIYFRKKCSWWPICLYLPYYPSAYIFHTKCRCADDLVQKFRLKSGPNAAFGQL